MEEYQDIEELFRENLTELNVKPGNRVWNGISNNLWFSDIQNNFRNYSVQPSSDIYKIISLKLWFRRFMAYSPARFNIYYLSSAIVTGLILFYFIQSDLPHNVHNNNTVSQSNLADSYSHKYSYPAVNTGKTNEASGRNSQPAVNTGFTQALNDISKTGTPFTVKANPEPGYSNFISVPAETGQIILPEEQPLFSLLERRNIVLPGFGETPDILSLRESPGYSIKKYQWSVEVFHQHLFNRSVYNFKNNEFVYENDNNISCGHSFGVSAQVSNFNFSLQTGISSTFLSSFPEYKYTYYTFDTTLLTQIIPGGYYELDTIFILNLDTLLITGDTAWIVLTDSTFIPQKDTVTVQQVNAHKNQSKKRASNVYSYIEIPLIAGYKFKHGRFGLTLRAGVIAGILTSGKGNIPSPYSEFGTSPLSSNLTTKRLIFSGYTGFEFSYYLNKTLQVTASPFYRFTLGSVLKNNYPVEQKFYSYGLKLSCRYDF